MSVYTLLAQLAALDVRITVDGDRLRIDAPRNTLTTGLRDLVATHKPDLLAVLRHVPQAGDPDPPVSQGWSPESWRWWLLHLADGCETLWPELACGYRVWADRVDPVVVNDGANGGPRLVSR